MVQTTPSLQIVDAISIDLQPVKAKKWRKTEVFFTPKTMPEWFFGINKKIELFLGGLLYTLARVCSQNRICNAGRGFAPGISLL